MKSPQYSLIGTKSEDKAQTMANHETPLSVLAVADENRIEDYISTMTKIMRLAMNTGETKTNFAHQSYNKPNSYIF
jgi:hypothetical protein